MVNIIMHGCGGKMGQVVSSIVREDKECQIIAGVDPRDDITMDYPVYKTLEECPNADVVIDFSTAKAVPALIDYCESKKIALVLCTTGIETDTIKKLEDASKNTAVLRSANMSVGVNLLLKLVKEAAKQLSESGFDIEIVEKHHNKKIDAPSGTAIALADSINEALDNRYEYVYDRSQKTEKRNKNEIGIHAVRGGTIVGEHDVIFAGKDEVITFSHLAMSKEIFAVGAVRAAKYIAGKPAGFYIMQNVME